MTTETKNAMETLRVIAAECRAQLTRLYSLPLDAWTKLADELEVAKNDREYAAKKLALRKLRAEGKLV